MVWLGHGMNRIRILSPRVLPDFQIRSVMVINVLIKQAFALGNNNKKCISLKIRRSVVF